LESLSKWKIYIQLFNEWYVKQQKCIQ
jgi:hypothetical protein